MDRRQLLSTTWLTGAVMALALPAHAQPAPNARPAGGSVVAGAATISQSSSTTTIDQSSQRAAINWQSFNIGSQQTVQFDQPSSSAVALNRVVGPNPSEIAGRIDANGQVIITNQSGVMFYKGSQVNTAGLMVTAAGIGNADFMAGRMVFDQAAHPNAAVVNQGSITVRDAGLAALVAPQVANSGVINARLGHVVLAGAEKATLDLYGDGLMAIDVTGQVVRAPNGATALVTNTGVIRADGGTVQLTARAADGVIQTLVDAGGKVSAGTVGDRTGSIVLNGVGGSITVAGQLTATGSAPGTSGGNIEVDASGGVAIAPAARIDASGQAGGGVVAIGTTLARAQGGAGTVAQQTAANVTVAAGATIAANATAKGNGGRVAVLSSNHTALNGAISAKGGPKGGNGGFVETSGHTLSLGPAASVDTSAPLGQTGTWLLDPTNWTIANSGGDETPLQVVNALALSRVFIQADNDITVSDAIDATTNVNAVNSLSLEAGRSIAINASITMNGGNFFAIANDSFDLPGTSALPDRAIGAGSFTMAAGATINTSVGAASLNITVDQAAANTGGGGAFVPGVISPTNLTTGGGEATAFGGSAITLSGVVAAGAGTVELGTDGAGGIAVDGPVNAGRVLMFPTTAGVTQNAAGIITAGALGIESAGSVNLLAANAVNTLAATVSDAGSSFLFRDAATPLTVGTVVIPTDNATFIVGITTNDGRVALATTGSGDVTVNQTISSAGTVGGGEIDIAVAPGSAFINNTFGLRTNAQAIGALVSGGGNIVILADDMTFTPASTVAAGAGTVVLGPATTTDNIVLGGASSTGTLGLQNSDLATIGAGMIEIGYRAEDATASFTGSIGIEAAGITLNPAVIPTLLLVTGGTSGTVSETAPVTFSAAGGTLGVIAGGTVTLSGANAVATLAGYADNGSAFTYSNSGPLAVGVLPSQQLGVAVDPASGLASSAPMASGAGNPSNPLAGVTATGGGAIALTTTGGGLTLANNVSAFGQTVTLTAGGTITQTAGVITAGTLTGSSIGGATLPLGNLVTSVGTFTDTGADSTGISFTDAQALGTSGTVSSATGPVALTTTGAGSNLTLGAAVTVSDNTVTLDSAGTIDQTGGVITATTLTGQSVGGASMTQGNQVTSLGAFTDTGPGSTGVSFTDAQALGTTGTVSSASGPVTLTTTGTGSNLTLGAAVTSAGNTVALDSTGTVDQTGGVITAGTLTGTSVGGTSLILGNLVTTLGTFTDTGAGSTGIAFTDARALGTTGTVSSASGPITLTTTGGSSNLTLGGDVTASGNTVTLDSAGTIGQTGGVISAATLTGNSAGGASLTDGNLVISLGTFTDTGAASGGISFTDARALGTTGTVSSATGPVTLTTTGTGSDLTLGAAVTAAGSAVTLDSAGTVDQTGGVITAATLTGTSTGGTSLILGNLVTSLGTFTDTGAGSTGIAFTDARALGTTGTVSSASGPIALTTTGGGSNLTVGGDVTASGNTVTLDSAGTIGQTGGVISAATLTGNSAGGASLTDGNLVISLGTFTDTGAGSGGISFTDARALGTTGTVSSATGPVTLTTTGTGSDLTLGAAVTAAGNTVTLDSAGTIGQTGGVITAATLAGGSVGGATLTLGNQVTSLGTFTDTGAGSTGVLFTDAMALGTTGAVSSASGPVTLTTTGAGSNLTLGAAVTATGNTVTLDSAGTIGQTGGVISAATLTGNSVGGVTLGQGNLVAAVGAFTDTGAGSTGIAFTDAQPLDTTGTVSSASGPITLTTTGTGSTLTLGAAVTANGNTVTLDSAGMIGQTGGVITAATLTGNSVGGASLTQGNLVAALGTFLDSGAGSTGIAFTNAQALGTTGTVSSATGPVTLTTTGAGSNLALGADVIATAATVTLTSAGTLNQTVGVIDAATLTGSSAGGATMLQDNAIGTLGPFTAASLALFDGAPLTIDGPVDANFLTITATGRMTLAGNIATIGAPLSQQSGPTPAPGGSTLQVVAARGNFEAGAQFVQTGTSVLTDPPGTTLRIQLPANGGTATFANLDGPGANVVLVLGTGMATGNMEVGGLLVLGQAGSANLFGSVDGVTTRAAAALAQIIPSIDPNYTFNDCVIGAAFCGAPTQTLLPPFLGLTTVLTGPALPPVPPLPTLSLYVLVTPPLLTGELAPQDVVPPNISFEDY